MGCMLDSSGSIFDYASILEYATPEEYAAIEKEEEELGEKNDRDEDETIDIQEYIVNKYLYISRERDPLWQEIKKVEEKEKSASESPAK